VIVGITYEYPMPPDYSIIRMTAIVRNVGRGAAGPFQVLLTAPGNSTDEAQVAGLEPDQEANVSGQMRSEPGFAFSLTATADWRTRINESNESNNSLTVGP
jgi:subtilase family serine protease